MTGLAEGLAADILKKGARKKPEDEEEEPADEVETAVGDLFDAYKSGDKAAGAAALRAAVSSCMVDYGPEKK